MILFSQHETELIENFIKSRHSIRNFNGIPVSKELLYKAINLALNCPTACNRQPFKVYVVTKEAKKSIVGESDYNAFYWLYITGDISAYNINEFNDWIVSATIFAGYLSLTLHLYNIGSCIMRKDLVIQTNYNKSVKELCSIPKNEKLILELAVGNYNSPFIAPISNKQNAENLVKIISTHNNGI